MSTHLDSRLSIAKMQKLFSYDPLTGIVSYRSTGKVPGYVKKANGGLEYLVTYVRSKQVYVHRIAWVIMTGSWPSNNIDHINGRGLDNRWLNLRDVPQTINMHNVAGLMKTNTSGIRGVYFRKDKQAWESAIRWQGKRRFLGLFATKEAAGRAYQDTRQALLGALEMRS